jgi:type I restriction enzyme M protein
LKTRTDELDLKLQHKRLGDADFKAENQLLIQQVTDEETKTLILKKLHDLATHELNRYLNAAKRHLILSVETLWDKYAVSSRALETERTETLTGLDGFLTGLGYLK